MRGRRNWGRVAIAVGAVAAMAIMVSPALGGPSLKKLVKKEVARQISKARGPQGPPGVNGAANVTYRRVSDTVGDGFSTFLNAKCQSGERLIGGGGGFVQQAGMLNYDASDRISADGPGIETGTSTATPVAEGQQPNVWHVSGTNNSGSDKDLVAYAVCASP